MATTIANRKIQSESTVRELRLDQVIDLAETKDLRAGGINQEHVDAIVLVIDRLEPIEVVAVEGGQYGTIDGYHRRQAHAQAGKNTILAVVRDIEPGDWLAFAVRANLGHGLRFTTDDRKAAARRLIAEAPERSDRAIAADCGLSPTVVGKVRHELEAASRIAHNKAKRTGKGPGQRVNRQLSTSGQFRVGRDGKRRPAQRGAAHAAAEAAARAEPDATLEEIAKATGASVSTVGTVRRLVRRAAAPDPAEPHTESADDQADDDPAPKALTDHAVNVFITSIIEAATAARSLGGPARMQVPAKHADKLRNAVEYFRDDLFERYVW